MTTTPSLPSRRTIVRGAAWSLPAVTVVAAVPAFAASSDPATCSPTGCKFPGDGPHTKDYAVTLNCSGYGTAVQVLIDGQQAEEADPGVWLVKGQPDSQAKLMVQVFFADHRTWDGLVMFKPCG